MIAYEQGIKNRVVEKPRRKLISANFKSSLCFMYGLKDGMVRLRSYCAPLAGKQPVPG